MTDPMDELRQASADLQQMENLTPPPELVQQWIKECDTPDNPRWQEYEQDIATRAAQWGADQELDACCEWLTLTQGQWELAADLRAARRPKPPNLKEQAITELDALEELGVCNAGIIRRALERLQQLEDQQ